MNVSSLNPNHYPQFEVKDQLKDMSDDLLIQKGRDCANASKGAEAAAFVRAVKDPVKKEALINEFLEIFAQLDPSSDQGYDTMSSFVQGLPI